jgi:putative ubiquitin-RnfH superfamily antitoxin RatB of RatAB toxin-antitoxin module
MAHKDQQTNQPASAPLLEVAVCFAVPGQPIWYKSCQLPLGSTVADAVHCCGFETAFPGVDWQTTGVGVYGQRCEPDTPLNPGDRVEIYQPLIFDPKESRRRRAEHRRLKLSKGDRTNGRQSAGRNPRM